MSAVVEPGQVTVLERCMAVGGVAVFPSDTVYGVACDPGHREAHRRLCMMKGRDPGQPCAVMFFSLDRALESLPEIGPRTHAALSALLPGPVLALLPNPAARYPLACGQQIDTLGIRVPALGPATAALEEMRWPLLQTSANLAGGPEAQHAGGAAAVGDGGGPEAGRIEEVPARLRDEADLVIDAGELPGVPSTVVDLRDYEFEGAWSVLREGALAEEEVAGRLS